MTRIPFGETYAVLTRLPPPPRLAAMQPMTPEERFEETNERLNILINVVERYFSSDGGGRPH